MKTNTDHPPRKERFLRATVTAAVVASVAGGLAAIGATDPYGSVQPKVTPPIAVAVEAVTLEPGYEVLREFLGVVEARRESRVGFELGGEIAAVLYDDGDFIDAGEVIARLDTSILDAERAVLVAARDQARAALELAAITRERLGKALAKNAVSSQNWDEADKGHQAQAAALAGAEAAITAIDARLAKAELRAPFAALVAERFVDEGQVVGAGSPVIHVLESVEPEVRIGVAGDSIDDIQPGDRFELAIRDRVESATVRSILPVRGNGTRSVDVVLTLHAQFDGIRHGDLATLAIPRTEAKPGFWLPLTALTESSRGLWANYVAEPLPEHERVGSATHRIVRRELEILHHAGDRVFVRGTLRDGELAVTEGLQRIVPAQLVRIAPSDAFSTWRKAP